MQRSLLLLLLLPVLALGRPDPPKPDSTIQPGTLKFSDECTEDRECGFDGSYCDPKVRRCLCREEFRATNHIDKCGHAANINESCFFTEQCEVSVAQTECRDGRCICIFEKVPVQNKDGSIQCIAEVKEPQDLRYVDPAMIGILAGMALMFIIICIVLRLFSQARWRDNRTIFNTPNARLMNVSLLRDNKLLHGQERRGSRASVRGPSRQPSMASLRAHSPNASQDEKILLNNDKGKRGGSGGNECAAFSPIQDTRITDHCTSPLSPGSKVGSRRGSRGSGGSQAGGQAANKSNRSPPNHQEPVLENVTVEILEDKS